MTVRGEPAPCRLSTSEHDTILGPLPGNANTLKGVIPDGVVRYCSVWNLLLHVWVSKAIHGHHNAGHHLAGWDYKTVLITAQVLGYTLSKFIGIRVIAEITPRWRAVGILTLIGFAEIALLLFGLVPPPYSAICLFLNGLPLGMVFGLVLGYLEGRRVTEALTPDSVPVLFSLMALQRPWVRSCSLWGCLNSGCPRRLVGCS